MISISGRFTAMQTQERIARERFLLIARTANPTKTTITMTAIAIIRVLESDVTG